MSGENVLRTNVCPVCMNKYVLELQEVRDGRLIQEQFPDTKPWEREQLLSGICSQECWDGAFGPDPDTPCECGETISTCICTKSGYLDEYPEF